MKHIIFDLDGTLIDSQDGIVNTISKTVKQLWNEDVIVPKTALGPPIGNILNNFFPEKSKDDVIKGVALFRSLYDSYGWKGYYVFPNVSEVIINLKHRGLTLSIATNKPEIPTMKILNDAQLTGFFDNILCFDKLKYPSKAEMVSEIVSDDKKKYTCLVGDSNDDLNAAEKNDIDFIFCSYGYGVLNGYAGKEISSFIEILEKI